MPWRTEASAKTSTPLNLTPMWLRICTTAAEKPHCGKTGVPFMNSTTGASVTCWRMRSCTVVSISRSSFDVKTPQRGCGAVVSNWALVLGEARLQGEGVQLVAHSATQRLVHQLMLLHPALAAEGAGDNVRGIMVAVAPQVL